MTPGKNHPLLMPGALSDDSSSPSMHRLSQLCAPSSCLATDNGLLPSHHLSDAIVDSSSTAVCRCFSWNSKCSPLSKELLTSAFLSEFSPFCDSHCLLPLDTSDISPHSLESALSAITDGSLKPYCDDNNDPKWAKAMASPEHKFWIAGTCEEL